MRWQSKRQSKWNRPGGTGRPGRCPAETPASATESERGEQTGAAGLSGPSGDRLRLAPWPSYRCPGCDQLLAAGVGHVVAWPADDPEATDRRHWHTTCWQARDRRAPGTERSRNAPRYG